MEDMLSSKKFDVLIIGGLGHVGLPLGIMFAKEGLNVCLLDVDKSKAEMVQRGIMPFVEYGAEPILKEVIENGKLKVSFNKRDISNSRNIIITIGTGIDEYLSPKTKTFIDSIMEIKEFFDHTQTLIIRSTIYPGLCEQLSKRLENKVNIAYCPERIVQGYAIKEIPKLPQIVSGVNEKAIKAAEELFRKVSPEIVHTSVGEAELVKLFSNSLRYIQFATTNQFYMLAKKLGVDYGNVRRAMTQGYERANHLPSPGFAAGPCLFKDTMHLVASDDAHFPLGNSAVIINEGLPNFIIDDLRKRYDLVNKKVGILGMAFKADVDDIRDSLSYKLSKLLKFYGAKVYCSDEFVKDPVFIPIEEILKECEIIIIGAPHSKYKEISFPEEIEVIDLWGITERH